jgi:hypothetical protein
MRPERRIFVSQPSFLDISTQYRTNQKVPLPIATMIRPISVVATCLALALPLATTIYAFHGPSPATSHRTEAVACRASKVPGAYHPRFSPFVSLKRHSACGVIVKMSSENDNPSSDSKAVVSADGTFYDDEVSESRFCGTDMYSWRVHVLHRISHFFIVRHHLYSLGTLPVGGFGTQKGRD